MLIISKKATDNNARILIFDDEAIVLNILKKILIRLGYDCVAVDSGIETINEYIKSKDMGMPFDITIIDLTVKQGLNGIKIMQRIKDIDPEAVVVAASGDPFDDVMINYEKYGFAGKIEKPFSMDELKNLLSGLLKVRTPVV